MTDYNMLLEKYKQGGQDWWNREDPQAVLKMLYTYYREHCPGDPEEISREFQNLDSVLSRLTLKEYDRVWNLACRLCSEHEEAGFLEGVRAGAALAEALNK